MKDHHRHYLTFAFWGLFLVIVLLLNIVQDFERTVIGSYIGGAIHWFNGKPLYYSGGTGFLYFPHSAILSGLFAFFPKQISYSICLSTLVLFLAFSVFTFVKNLYNKNTSQYFLFYSLVTIPIAFSSATVGQFNITVIATMLLASTSIYKEKWNIAVFWMVLGFALKPIVLVFLLLCWAVYRPLWLKMAIGMVLFLLFPFLFQYPTYVLEQYKGCYQMLTIAHEVGVTGTNWAQLFGFFSHFSLEITSSFIQTVIRMLMALVTLVIALRIKLIATHRETVIYILGLSACYLMLFNPRTENSTYVVLAPTIASLWIASGYNLKNYMSLSCFLAALISVMSYYISNLIIPGHSSWAAPIAAIIISINLMIYYFKFEKRIGVKRQITEGCAELV